MGIGEMDKRIEIKTRGKSQNSLGEVEYSYSTTLATVWAKVEEMGGNETETASVLTISRKAKFTIRNSFGATSVTTKNRIVYDYEWWDISSAVKLADGHYIELTAQTLQPELSA